VRKLKILDIEVALTNSLYKITRYFVVPNVSWGLGFNHELDILAVTKDGYATEIEIKTSKQDTIKDLEKSHKHYSDKLKYLYFAIPEYGESWIEHIPKDAGVILIKRKNNGHLYGVVFRKAEANKKCRKLTIDEQIKLGRLAAMRIWKLKKKVDKLQK
jgi:hypothetical protein